MKCSKAIKQLPAYLDNELSQREAAELRRHLEVCVFCSTELRALQATSKMLDSWQSISPRRCYAENVLNQIEAEERGVRRGSAIGARLFEWRWACGAIRAAAAILFVIGATVFSGRLPVERAMHKLPLTQPARALIPLGEDFPRSYIRPSEFGLVLRDIDNRAAVIKASSVHSPMRRTDNGSLFPRRARFPEINHIYFPEEGMPIESVIPLE